LLSALTLASCSSEPRRDWPTPSPALWEVTGIDGQHGWLFGTIHALPNGVEWHTPVLKQALADSSVLVVEIADLAEGDGGLFEKVAHTPGQMPLSQRVEPDERRALTVLLKRAGKRDGDFADTESWAAALILSSAIRSADPANGVDRALMEKAERVEGLESFAAQYALFDTLAPADQSDLLAAVAADAAGGDSSGPTEAWLTGDMNALEAAISGGILDYPNLREVLVIGRNQEWAGKVTAMMASEQPFVAVGAGHMIGDAGLPALLAKRGYEVRRIQ